MPDLKIQTGEETPVLFTKYTKVLLKVQVQVERAVEKQTLERCSLVGECCDLGKREKRNFSESGMLKLPLGRTKGSDTG